MAYINLTTKQYPITETQIRATYPDTSFAIPFSPDGYAVVFPVPQPEYDKYQVKCLEGTPNLSDKGHWEQTWYLLPLSIEELADAQLLFEEENKLTEQKVQSALDAFAKEKDFDNINDAVSYIDSTNALWAQEAAQAIALRDQAWTAFYANEPLPTLTWENTNAI